jgi:hypothetical protein
VRKALGAILLGLGLVAAVLGIISHRLWPYRAHIEATAHAQGEPYLRTAPGVLRMDDSEVTITASTDPAQPISLIIGRDVDVTGWLAGINYTEVTGLADWDTLDVRQVLEPGDPTAPATTLPPDPLGNDMWIQQVSGTGTVSMTWHQDAVSNVSPLLPEKELVLLVAAPGAQEPPAVTLGWEWESRTPYRWPLIIPGVLSILAGSALLLLGGRRLLPAGAVDSVLPVLPLPAEVGTDADAAYAPQPWIPYGEPPATIVDDDAVLFAKEPAAVGAADLRDIEDDGTLFAEAPLLAAIMTDDEAVPGRTDSAAADFASDGALFADNPAMFADDYVERPIYFTPDMFEELAAPKPAKPSLILGNVFGAPKVQTPPLGETVVGSAAGAPLSGAPVVPAETVPAVVAPVNDVPVSDVPESGVETAVESSAVSVAESGEPVVEDSGEESTPQEAVAEPVEPAAKTTETRRKPARTWFWQRGSGGSGTSGSGSGGQDVSKDEPLKPWTGPKPKHLHVAQASKPAPAPDEAVEVAEERRVTPASQITTPAPHIATPAPQVAMDAPQMATTAAQVDLRPAKSVIEHAPTLPSLEERMATEPPTDTGYLQVVKRSELRRARREAEATGNYEKLEALTGAIRIVPEPPATTSEVPVRATSWRATWGLPDPNPDPNPEGGGAHANESGQPKGGQP